MKRIAAHEGVEKVIVYSLQEELPIRSSPPMENPILFKHVGNIAPLLTKVGAAPAAARRIERRGDPAARALALRDGHRPPCCLRHTWGPACGRAPRRRRVAAIARPPYRPARAGVSHGLHARPACAACSRRCTGWHRPRAARLCCMLALAVQDAQRSAARACGVPHRSSRPLRASTQRMTWWSCACVPRRMKSWSSPSETTP